MVALPREKYIYTRPYTVAHGNCRYVGAACCTVRIDGAQQVRCSERHIRYEHVPHKPFGRVACGLDRVHRVERGALERQFHEVTLIF